MNFPGLKIRDARSVVLENVVRKLYEQLGDDATLVQLAEGLVAIADQQRIRYEDFMTWLDVRMPEKTWSCEEFTRWCEKFNAARKLLPDYQHEPHEPTWQLCRSCQERVAQLVAGEWWCAQCGKLPLAWGFPNLFPRRKRPPLVQ